jgi:hypothetical protein
MVIWFFMSRKYDYYESISFNELQYWINICMVENIWNIVIQKEEAPKYLVVENIRSLHQTKWKY